MEKASILKLVQGNEGNRTKSFLFQHLSKSFRKI